jgi:predicted Zn-ribbon and HTH transcriptional regulator
MVVLACPPAFKRALERLQVTCLDDTWRTRQVTYRFRCKAGHEFAWKADNLTGLSACPQCRADSRTRRMQEKAAQAGSECLDSWRGTKNELYRYRCLKDPSHEWLRSFPVAMRTSRCPHCTSIRVAKGKMAVNGLQRLQDYAKSRGGKLLSPVYLGGEFKHTFGCARGHTWEARPSHVLGKRQWCQQCRSDEQRHSVEQACATAGVRGGRFLSTTYLNSNTIYAWECHEGHTWRTSYASIRAGTWCPHCANDDRRLDLKVLRNAAAALGGICLSEVYTGSRINYQWQCAKGHIWKAQYSSIRDGHWCRKCHNVSQRLTVADMQKTARDRGGQCLSTTYLNNHTHYQWLCARGHTWRATYGRIRLGTWCPTCHHMSRTKPGTAAWRRYQTHQPRD